jgi:tetratricopeptide (TPR) repeat protein
MRDYAKAAPLLQEALKILQKVLGPENPDTLTGLNNLALLYWAMGEYGKAEPLYQEALRIRKKVLGSEHANTATSLNDLALLYSTMGSIVGQGRGALLRSKLKYDSRRRKKGCRRLEFREFNRHIEGK